MDHKDVGAMVEIKQWPAGKGLRRDTVSDLQISFSDLQTGDHDTAISEQNAPTTLTMHVLEDTQTFSA